MNEKAERSKVVGEIFKGPGPDGSTMFYIRRPQTDTVVGEAEFLESPNYPGCYVLTEMKVKHDEQGKGFASQLMAEAERISRKTNKPIIIEDGIWPDDENQNPKSVGMYDKRPGWTRVVRADRSPTHYLVYGTQDPELFERLIENADKTY